MKKPQILTGANLFVEGVGHLGTSKIMTLPKLEFETEKQSTGGLTRHIDLATLKEMEAEFELEEYSSVVYTALKKRTGDAAFLVKANIRQGARDLPVIATLKGVVSLLDDGTMESKKQAARKVKLGVNYYSLELDGKQEVLVDVENMILEIDGVDLLEQARANLV